MPTLDKNQVQLIEGDVEMARITLSHLSQELVDHICCEVEVMMNNGKTFDEAYAIMRSQAGIETLQRIQENARYLIDKNYRIMKTTMKVTGNIALALLGVGTMFKINHFPGASIALVLGFALLCFFFFPAAIYLNYKSDEEKKRPVMNLSILIGGILLMIGVLFKMMHWPGASPLMVLGWTIILLIFLPILLYVKLEGANTRKERWTYVLGVLALVIFELATMFKIMHWPGAGPLLIVGMFLLVSVFLPMFTYSKFKETGIISGQFIFLIILSMHAVALTALLAMNVSQPILESYARKAATGMEITKYFETKSEQVVTDTLATPSQMQLASIKEQANKLHGIIESIKLDLVQTSDNIDREEAVRRISNPELIMAKDNHEFVNMLLVGNGRDGRGGELKQAIEAFRKSAATVTSGNTELSKNIELLLNTDDMQDNGMRSSWEVYNFKYNILISTVLLLGQMEQNVRVVESATVAYIQQQHS